MRRFTPIMIAALVTLCAQLGFAAEKKAPAKPAAKPAAESSGSWSRNYGTAGCGLGSIIISKKTAQIFAATTNDTLSNQSFAISSGTSNCEDKPTAEVAFRMDTFIAANKVAVASDIARGRGETLQNLSALMGCGDQTDRFDVAMQKNFSAIFPSADVATNEVTDSIINVVLSDQDLAETCKKVS